MNNLKEGRQELPMSQNTQAPVDFVFEETEFYDNLPRAAVAVYKFFDLFRVEMGDKDAAASATVYFGKSYEDDEVPRELAKQVKSYVKDQKRAIRDAGRGYTAEEGRRKIFWFLTMLFQHGIFGPREQSKIMTYAQFVFHETKEEE